MYVKSKNPLFLKNVKFPSWKIIPTISDQNNLKFQLRRQADLIYSEAPH